MIYGPEEDDMALPAGKSCADCRNYERCRAFIGARHIHDKQTRCDWAPSRFWERVITPPSTGTHR